MSMKSSVNKKTKKLLVNGFYLISILILALVGISTFLTIPSLEGIVGTVTFNYLLFLTTVLLTSKLCYSATFSKGLRYKYFSVLGITSIGFSLHLTLLESLQQCGYLISWYLGVILFLSLLYNYILVPTVTKGIVLGALISLLSVLVPQMHFLFVVLVLTSIGIYKQNKMKFRFQAILPIAISIVVFVNLFWNIDFISNFSLNFPSSIHNYTKLLFLFLVFHFLFYVTNKPTIRTLFYLVSFFFAIGISIVVPMALSFHPQFALERIWHILLLTFPVLLYATVLSFDATLDTVTSYKSLFKTVAIRTTLSFVIAGSVWYLWVVRV